MTPQKKRIIIACDDFCGLVHFLPSATDNYQNSDSDWNSDSWWPWQSKKNLHQDPSNVTRICRAMLNDSLDGLPQICYYQAGIGSEGTISTHIYGGLTGKGISDNIREAYAFLSNNWNKGDEIILLGFSRGAFTARSIGSLVCDIGILKPKGMVDFLPIFHDWEHQLDKKLHQQAFSDWPVGNPRLSFSDGTYQSELEARDMTNRHVPIKAIGVWDTVGSLGIPDMSFSMFSLRKGWKEFTLANSEVPENVEYAFQALALDEQRRPFSPTVWESPKSPTAALKELKQCWFPGVHANIGGSYADTGIADLTLTWMISQFQRHKIMDFDPLYCPNQRQANEQYYRMLNPSQPPRSWGLGRVYDSFDLVYLLTGSLPRTPGRYTKTDARTFQPTNERLKNTCEVIHPSVRIRHQMHGKDAQDYGPYKSIAMPLRRDRGDWTYVAPGEFTGKGTYTWVSDRRESSGDCVSIPEEILGPAEVELIKLSPEVWDRFQSTLGYSE